MGINRDVMSRGGFRQSSLTLITVDPADYANNFFFKITQPMG